MTDSFYMWQKLHSNKEHWLQVECNKQGKMKPTIIKKIQTISSKNNCRTEATPLWQCLKQNCTSWDFQNWYLRQIFINGSVCVVDVWIKTVFIHGDGSVMVQTVCYGLHSYVMGVIRSNYSSASLYNNQSRLFYRMWWSQWYKHWYFQMFPIFSHGNPCRHTRHHWLIIDTLV